MRNFYLFTLLFALLIGTNMSAQENKVTIQNPTAGKLPYIFPEQNIKEINELILIGNFNDYDFQYLKEMKNRYNWHPNSINMLDANYVDSQGSIINTINDLEDFARMAPFYAKKMTFPKTIEHLSINVQQGDTIIIGSKHISGEICGLSKHWYDSGIGKIILLEGVEDISGFSAPKSSVITIPKTLKCIHDQIAIEHKAIEKIDYNYNIEYMGRPGYDETTSYNKYPTPSKWGKNDNFGLGPDKIEMHFWGTYRFPHNLKIWSNYGLDKIQADTIVVPACCEYLDANITADVAYFYSKTPPYQSIHGKDCEANCFNIKKLYVPKGCVELYKAVYFGYNSSWQNRIGEFAEIEDINSISINNTEIHLCTSETSQLTVSIQPIDAINKNIKWESSNENIVKVDNKGLVTAIGEGEAVIYATSENGECRAECKVFVEDKEPHISFEKESVMLRGIGTKYKINTNVTPSSMNIRWNSSNKNICIVSNDGIITTQNNGSCIITATIIEGGYTASCIVTVTDPIDNYILNDGETHSYIEDETANTLTYNRNFSNTAWQALYVPFSMAYADWQKDFEIAKINDVNMYDLDDDGVIDISEIEIIKIKNGSLMPNNPYLIRAKTIGNKQIELKGTTIYAAESNSLECSTTEQTYTFTGTYKGVSGKDMLDNGYFALSNGSLCTVANDKTNLKPQRWYMKIESKGINQTIKTTMQVRLRILEEENNYTGIETKCNNVNDDFIYNIDGTVIAPGIKLQKGLYIKNNKKIIIK